MSFKAFSAGLLLSACAASSFAITTTTYSATFVSTGAGRFALDGFGRATNARIAPAALSARNVPPGFESFFDIWNIDTSQMAPGEYTFEDFLIDATGTLQFDSVVLSSFDVAGQRNAVVFEVSDDGLQAVGSGAFTVLAKCPVAVCVFLDIAGIQETGKPAGYGGDLVAAPAIPEPETYALMIAGLAAVGFIARRRKQVKG
jgi:PEP-CTERM motif